MTDKDIPEPINEIEICNRLNDDLYKTINYYSEEYGLSMPAIMGLLEHIKFSLWRDHYMENEEDD